MRERVYIFTKKTVSFALFALLFGLFSAVFAGAQNIDITGPIGSDNFGQQVFVLPNGNIVVTDSDYDIPSGATNVGAVYLYNGMTAALISTLTGSATDDRIGIDGVTILTNGNYVVLSRSWHNGPAQLAGAVTFCDSTTGCSSTVSAANSLVGSSNNDAIVTRVTALTNGNYVVGNPAWNNGAIPDVGAVTWCDGATGCFGPVSAANSFLGSTANDGVGNNITPLNNGNYVVTSSSWDTGAITDVGAVTFANGTTPLIGTVSTANSLVGSQTLDSVGQSGVTPLPNGNYLVHSSSWDNGAAIQAGALTFGNGTTGITGVVSAANSLVGSNPNDSVGSGNITVLTNGNFVAANIFWRNGTANNAGAATWCDGASGCAGTISAANSLVGTTTDDNIGSSGITALGNGNYVVRSPAWDNGAITNAGAVTFGNGATGINGPVAPANSLVGTHNNDLVGNILFAVLTNSNYLVISANWDNGGIVNAGAITWCSGGGGCVGAVSPGNSLAGSTIDDRIGSGGVIALTNGNYVVRSPNWHNGAAADAGAVTFADGTIGIAGQITAANSLVGTTANNPVGGFGVTPLTNGNYVVASASWDNGAIADVGAATFGSGTTGVTGTISAANSLIGSNPGDFVGTGIIALTNGNYVVVSSSWHNGAISNVGAVTFGNGTTGITGTISAANSLVGSNPNDSVGGTSVTALPNGNYVVRSNNWDNGANANAGAVTKGNGRIGTKGVVDASNSVLGTAPNGGTAMKVVFDPVNNQMVVGRPADNIVTIARPFGPVAASLSITGRVINGKAGIAGAIVSITNSGGNVRSVKTNTFGNFKFENIQAGETLIFQVRAKGLSFNPQIITVYDDITDLNFIADL